VILLEYIKKRGDGGWSKVPEKEGQSQQICYIGILMQTLIVLNGKIS
jgi:hypothetical protein